MLVQIVYVELKLPSSAISCGHVERDFGYLGTAEASRVPALQTESKLQGIFGTFNQACVPLEFFVHQRYPIGLDGGGRTVSLCATCQDHRGCQSDAQFQCE